MVNIELMSGRLRGAPKGFRDFANQGFGALSPSSTSRRVGRRSGRIGQRDSATESGAESKRDHPR
jgi:hypothetical protein